MITMTMTQPPPLNLASPAVTAPSPQHLEQIAAAKKRGKPITRCVSVATGSAWTIALFGALTVVTSIGSLVGMLLGAGMCVLSHFEFKGAREIKRLDAGAPKRLARNQLILGAAILLYSGVSLFSSLTQPSELERELGKEAAGSSMVGSIGEMEKTAYIALYGTMIVAAILGCGGTALYYARRKQYIEAYLRETPQWIIELQKAGMSV
jgi:hypothetical protein